MNIELAIMVIGDSERKSDTLPVHDLAVSEGLDWGGSWIGAGKLREHRLMLSVFCFLR
jgi:hypothetical protein